MDFGHREHLVAAGHAVNLRGQKSLVTSFQNALSEELDRAFSFAVVTALCAVGILGTAHRAVATGRLLRTSSCCSHGSVSRFGCNHAPAAENFRIAADTAASTAVATALCAVQLFTPTAVVAGVSRARFTTESREKNRNSVEAAVR